MADIQKLVDQGSKHDMGPDATVNMTSHPSQMEKYGGTGIVARYQENEEASKDDEVQG